MVSLWWQQMVAAYSSMRARRCRCGCDELGELQKTGLDQIRPEYERFWEEVGPVGIGPWPQGVKHTAILGAPNRTTFFGLAGRESQPVASGAD